MTKKLIALLMSILCVWGVVFCCPFVTKTTAQTVNAYLYTNKKHSMPPTGTAKTVLFMVQFPDYKNTDASLTASAVKAKLFDAKNNESITGFYKTSSFGNLNIKGEVYGWYTAKNKRSSYNGTAGNAALFEEVLRYYDSLGVDFSSFDGDKDGIVDCVYLMFAGQTTGYDTDWWDSTGYLPVTFGQLDKKSFGSYIKLSSDDLATAVHETGHALGLWDYYTVSEDGTASYGLGGNDRMDDNTGDHNALSKILLGWITPTVVLGSDVSQLASVLIGAQSEGECVVYFTGNKVDYGAEYYVIERLTASGYYADHEQIGNGKFRMLYVNGTDAFGKPQVTFVEADGNGSVAGLSKWESSDLFSGGMAYAMNHSSNSNDYMLFLDQVSGDSLGMVCFLTDEQEETVTDRLHCSTEMLLLKKKTAFSPIVTDSKGVSVNRMLDWVSVNSKVATVSAAGKITAKAAGTTAIIGCRENANGSVDVVIIEVTVVSSLKKVTFAPSKESLTPGTKAKMSIRVGDQDLTDQLNITWGRSNSRITVSKTGTVKANKVGYSTVKATLEGGIILTYQFTVDFKTVKAKVSQTSAGKAKVTWNQISGASGYCVYRYNYKTKADPVLVATIKQSDILTYTDKKVKKGVNYAYQVFAYDDTQGETIYSTGSAWVNFTVK